MKRKLNECGCGCGGAKGGCQKPEGRMAKHDAMECADDARDVADMIQDEDNLPEWLEAKITLAADYMNRVKDYLTHYKQGSNMSGFGGNIKQPSFLPVDMPKDGDMKKFIHEIVRKIKEGHQLYSLKKNK